MKENNIIKKAWDKVKSKTNEIILESKIESNFKKKNISFSLYIKDNYLPVSLSGYIDGKDIIVFGDHNIPQYSIIINNLTDRAYYVIDAKNINVTTKMNGIDYVRNGTQLSVDENVEEVQVIKAGNRYFKSK